MFIIVAVLSFKSCHMYVFYNNNWQMFAKQKITCWMANIHSTGANRSKYSVGLDYKLLRRSAKQTSVVTCEITTVFVFQCRPISTVKHNFTINTITISVLIYCSGQISRLHCMRKGYHLLGLNECEHLMWLWERKNRCTLPTGSPN